MKRKGIKITEVYCRFFKHSGFKNKSEAQKFANDLRIENKRDNVEGVGVRVAERKEGWVVNVFDL